MTLPSWDDYRTFLAVLETGSLSAAGRKLGLSHPTVRARIEGLERSLGTILFTRSVNGLLPTEGAESMREAAASMAHAFDHLGRLASALPDEVGGRVRVSVPEVMGIEILPSMLASLLREHPALRIELDLSNAPADLLAKEADLAVRTVAPRQQALVARKVASIPLGLFASTAYLARRGSPGSASDLNRHALIGPDRNLGDLAVAGGLDLDPGAFVFRTDSHPAQLAAARAGVGIVLCQVPIGERDPSLIRLLDLEIRAIEVWIVAHENLLKVPRIRTVFDHLVEAFDAVMD